MILAVFGTIYAVCLAILAVALLKAKPLSAASSRPRNGDDGAEPVSQRAEGRGGLNSTHH